MHTLTVHEVSPPISFRAVGLYCGRILIHSWLVVHHGPVLLSDLCRVVPHLVSDTPAHRYRNHFARKLLLN